MDWKNKIPLTILAVNILTTLAAANAPAANMAWVGTLQQVAYTLGWLMMVLMGVKWIVADSPNERADAKKSMIYVVLGLLVVASACGLLHMYCDNAISSLNSASLTATNCNPGTYITGC